MADELKKEVKRAIEDNNDSDFDPFSDLEIASHEPLRGAERAPCPKCQTSRKYYCYECYTTVGIERSLVPSVTLPITVDIVKHRGELAGKSTATHAAILAPVQVTIYNYPDFPEIVDKQKVVAVFPSEEALTLQQWCKHDDMAKTEFNRVIFIDSTWQQSHKIITDGRLSGIRKVQIENAKTYFWRPQQKPNTCLATIEAIYFFFKEYEQHILQRWEYN
ncbi:tRNA-uridine aminocarboxypropyltransferase 1 isoform X2 [Nematostella vectensis]|uniref:tRNA-uridine aminocarboxypropyltransferase 1 isoform X2 n=1 Tax=Nematostella vectensis TaxID=45351 RepID=UPI0020779B0C|nr:tRNA-uridine aminocarboxypropyltransferase 1 isoform X2 [Nematostella vectensis]